MNRRLRRACLSVPATSERMLAKARGLEADEVIVDFEDAVSAEQKTNETRRKVGEAIGAAAWSASTLAVRVNAVATKWFSDDLEHLVGTAAGRVDCVVLPKVESADEVVAASEMLDRLGLAVGLEAQIESARGLVAVDAIAASSPRLEALVFGPGDYAASLGIADVAIGAIDPDYPGDQWQYPRSRIAVAAHAYGLDPIDGPYAAYRDADGLNESCRRARVLGFVGKWAIHPDQIVVCQAAFSPSSEEIERAERLLDVLEEVESRGEGAVGQAGVMVDSASRRMAATVISRRGAG